MNNNTQEAGKEAQAKIAAKDKADKAKDSKAETPE